jgi:hypothetical protein
VQVRYIHIDAAAPVLPHASWFGFEFSEGPPTVAPNLPPESDPLATLDQIAAAGGQSWIDHLLPLRTIPRVADSSPADDAQVTLPCLALFVLRDIDGAATVREIATRRGLVPTLKALGRLHELGLITVEADHPRIPPPSDPPPASVPGSPPSRARAVAVELGRALLVTGLFVLLLRGTLGTFRVEGVSMQPTFQSGQALIVNRTSYLFDGPRRGDVVVFKAPPQPDVDYSVLVQSGQVFVDGRLLAEDYGPIPPDYDFRSMASR